MKLNPIATAVNGQIAVIEFDAIQRAAAEKLPLKDAHRTLAKKLTEDLDAALLVAVEAHLGEPLTDPEILRGRLTNVTVEGEEGETYCLDGVPLLWAGPVSTTREGDTVRAERKLQQLVPDLTNLP